MNIKKLLDWRKALIYSHRWLGIILGAVFVMWCISGAVLMYYGLPTLTAGERLMRPYLAVLRRAMDEGVDRDDRTGTGTRAIFTGKSYRAKTQGQ